jgi:pSer/pThr/pTyr-binding forkhead associated (FHA) protein
MASMIVTAGEKRGMVYKLGDGPLVAGREVNHDVQLLDPKVSRRHFRVARDGDDGYVIEELSAKNGVYVNGRRVQRATLADGDRVRVGDTELIFLADDEPGRVDAFRHPRRLCAAARAATVRDATPHR